VTAAALGEMTRAEIAEVAPGAVLVIPFGATEQHGPRLPFGTDATVAEAVARAAAERADADTVVAPAFPYGASDHHLDVGGALSLGWQTFAACVADLLRSAAGAGFRRVFVVNGHGGNDEPLHLAAQTAAREHEIAVGGGSYWKLAAGGLDQSAAAVVPGHGGRFEAALVLALESPAKGAAPDAATTPNAEPPYWREDADGWREIDGFTDDPTPASAAEGAGYLETIVAAVAACIVDFERWSLR